MVVIVDILDIMGIMDINEMLEKMDQVGLESNWFTKFGPGWPHLALVVPIWPCLVQVGLNWHRFDQFVPIV